MAQRRVNAVRLRGDIKECPVPYIALHIPNQIMRRTALHRPMAAMEQAVNPMNSSKHDVGELPAKHCQKLVFRASTSKHRHDTRLDVDVDGRPFDLGTPRLARNRRSRADHGQPGSDKEPPVESHYRYSLGGPSEHRRGRKLPGTPFVGTSPLGIFTDDALARISCDYTTSNDRIEAFLLRWDNTASRLPRRAR